MEVVDAVVLKIVNDLDSESLARELAPAVREGLQGLALENILIELVRMLGEERHAKRILHSVLSISEQVLQSPAMQQVLLDNIKVLRKEYEGESAGRAFVLSALGLDDKEILAIFRPRAMHASRQALRAWFSPSATMRRCAACSGSGRSDGSSRWTSRA